MNRETKVETVAELQDTLSRVASLVITEFSGLTVEEANGLRQEIHKADCQYRVIKNTLIKRAVAGTRMEGIGKLFTGPSAIAFSYVDPVAPAKVIDKFTSGTKHLTVKGGYLEGKVLNENGVKDLASMKGKEELLAELLATFMAPAQSLVALLSAAPQNFLFLMKAREDRLGGE